MDVAESGPGPSIMPRKLKRARDFIHAHAHKKITLEELASYSGCSYRSLQITFGRLLGVSPMEYLKSVRLDGLRDELMNADSRQKTVSEIASQWGGIHMGRMAQMYKQQFGVLPSDTLNQKQ